MDISDVQVLTSQIIARILTQEMSMPIENVWVRDQNVLIPNDNGLYIVVGLISAPTVANVTRMEEKTVTINNAPVIEQHQISEVVQNETLQIDIFSRSNSALSRNWEVVAALQSFFSQQQQELYNFKIFRIPKAFLNTSSLEGGSNINRYSITIGAMVWYRKDTLMNSPLGDYYDDFKTRVDDEKTIGTPTPLISFEIDSGGIEP